MSSVFRLHFFLVIISQSEFWCSNRHKVMQKLYMVLFSQKFKKMQSNHLSHPSSPSDSDQMPLKHVMQVLAGRPYLLIWTCHMTTNPTWVLNLRFASLHVYLAPSQFLPTKPQVIHLTLDCVMST